MTLTSIELYMVKYLTEKEIDLVGKNRNDLRELYSKQKNKESQDNQNEVEIQYHRFLNANKTSPGWKIV